MRSAGRRCVPALLLVIAAALAATGCDRSRQDAAVDDPAPADAPQRPAPDAPAAESLQTAEVRIALEQLLRGGSETSGEHSWFSAETAGALRSVVVDSTGHAIVDFADLSALIPNASSSAGSSLLLEQLNATVFGIDGIQSVDYLMEGSCDRFWEWLQYGCHTVHRPTA
jgi:hypothetical protein